MKSILAQVKNLEITTKRLVDGLIAGNYHSIFRGQGIEFSEIRDYRPGDDIRSIDWNVTARFNHPYVKEFIEERDLRVYFLFDRSASGLFGNHKEKKRKGIELSASLMFSALKNNDQIGLILFTEDIEKFIPARKGKRHVLRLLTTLLSHEPQKKTTDISKALKFASKIIKKRSIFFLVSDFYGQEFAKPLKILKNKHDIIAIKIGDKREKEIPDIGYINLEDEETGEQILLDTSDKEFRENYKKEIEKEERRIKKVFKKGKVDTLELTTDESYEIPLKKFFKRRNHARI